MEKIVLVTGGFDPLHSGHIAYFKAAKQLGDRLVVGCNSDAWLARKKGAPFMPFEERAAIIEALACVDEVISFADSEDGSAHQAIHKLKSTTGYGQTIVFANGGDRGTDNTPEQRIYGDDPQVEFVFGVGGEDKRNSSSWILKNWQAPRTDRAWGHYRNIYSGEGFRVKELVIDPWLDLSMQRHEHRAETWCLVHGEAHVLMGPTLDKIVRYDLSSNVPLNIPAGMWHQGCNASNKPAHIVEIWRGETLTETDIERG